TAASLKTCVVLPGDRQNLIEAGYDGIKLRQGKIFAHLHSVLPGDFCSELRSSHTVVERLAEALISEEHQRGGHHQNQNSVLCHANPASGPIAFLIGYGIQPQKFSSKISGARARRYQG